ncbi:MAG TPA: hypothetical protein VFB72_14180 [Verrucomicrobiae bacterium]|nr:hypothetical protein [Verrucomicrobiae bacterium]
MKHLLTLLLSGCILTWAGCSSTPAHDNAVPVVTDTTKSPEVPWSVVGTWKCWHPAWRNTITISEDGKFYFGGTKEAGHWTLTNLGDHVALVLGWNRWPAETVTMVGPDDFRGKVHGGVMTMHRISSAKTD